MYILKNYPQMSERHQNRHPGASSVLRDQHRRTRPVNLPARDMEPHRYTRFIEDSRGRLYNFVRRVARALAPFIL